MAFATTRLTFSFRHHTPQSIPPSPKPPRTHFAVPLPIPKMSTRKSLSAHFSVDISKEDKPASDPEPTETLAEGEENEEETTFDKRRLEEKFAVLNIGISECRSCGYQYDQAAGDPSYPIPPGLEFGKLPDDWRCPTCGAAKSFFVSKSVEIAGFAQNQQFGLGGNTLTSGQKAVLIYGGLFLFFALFLSGYFLQ